MTGQEAEIQIRLSVADQILLEKAEADRDWETTWLMIQRWPLQGVDPLAERHGTL